MLFIGAQAKNHVLLSYNIHLAYMMLLKLHGRETQAHPCRERLVQLRVLLDKIKPIDSRLKYQIDKLVKAGASGVASALEEDPLQHRPKPDALVAKVFQEEELSDNGKIGNGSRSCNTMLFFLFSCLLSSPSCLCSSSSCFSCCCCCCCSSSSPSSSSSFLFSSFAHSRWATTQQTIMTPTVLAPRPCTSRHACPPYRTLRTTPRPPRPSVAV